MKRPTQKEMILNALEAGDRLTVLDALKRFGIFALSQRVTDLKRDGHPIKSEPYSFETEYGERKTISIYWMEG